jgi:hypothetical protein
MKNDGKSLEKERFKKRLKNDGFSDSRDTICDILFSSNVEGNLDVSQGKVLKRPGLSQFS